MKTIDVRIEWDGDWPINLDNIITSLKHFYRHKDGRNINFTVTELPTQEGRGEEKFTAKQVEKYLNEMLFTEPEDILAGKNNALYDALKNLPNINEYLQTKRPAQYGQRQKGKS